MLPALAIWSFVNFNPWLTRRHPPRPSAFFSLALHPSQQPVNMEWKWWAKAHPRGSSASECQRGLGFLLPTPWEINNDEMLIQYSCFLRGPREWLDMHAYSYCTVHYSNIQSPLQSNLSTVHIPVTGTVLPSPLSRSTGIFSTCLAPINIALL